MANADNFADAALLGHVVSMQLLVKLVEKGTISPAEASEILDESLLRLEEWQAHFPDHEPYFRIARDTFSELVDAVRSKMTKPSE
jgi:hypothetical protein